MAIPSIALIPTGTKAGTLYSVLPEDGSGDFTVVRATTATRVNSSGLIESVANNVPRLDYTDGGCPVLLTEPQSTNLITYPVSFGNSYWTKSGATIEGDKSTAGSELVTNGDFATDTDWVKQSSWTISGGTANYDGVDNLHSLQQTGYNIVSGKTYLFEFDIISGTTPMLAFAKASGSGLFSGFGATEYSVGSHKFYGLATSDSTDLGLYAFNASGGTAFSIDNVSVKEVQGFTSPSADSPTGAFKFVESALNETHLLSKSNIAAANGETTMSIIAKAGERDWIFLIDTESVEGWRFDLNNGVLGNSYSTAASATIESLGNGWYKCSVTTTNTTGKVDYQCYLSEDGTEGLGVGYQGDGTSGVYIYGAQLEALSYPTSLMLPLTEGSTTTRNADQVTDSGDVNDFNSTEGVLMVESSALNINTSGFGSTYVNDGTDSNRIAIRYSSTDNTVNFLIQSTGSAAQQQDIIVSDVTEIKKMAVKWDSNDVSFWIDGFQVGTTITTFVTFTSGTLNQMNLVRPNGTEDFYAKTKQIQVFKSALTSLEIETLTSWTSFILMANAQQYNIE